MHDTDDATNIGHFGRWLSRQRKALDLTQEDLAERTGCSLSLIQKIEMGNRRPSKQVAEVLADFFHIPTAEREAFLHFARGHQDERQKTKDEGMVNLDPSPSGVGHLPIHNLHIETRTVTGRQAKVEHPNNLPIQLTSFVGRAIELPRIRDLMLTAEVRLLTLTGPPGTGKTRLALHVAAELLREFEDGVFFINLAPITDPDVVISEIAQTLGVSETWSKSLLEGVKTYLGDKRIVLVLDNFEQVVEAAPVVGELLTRAPGVKVMVSSRVPLHIRGEKEFVVPPLHLPDLQYLPPLERLGRYEAIQLFLERATDVGTDFELMEDNASAVAHICARLDGLPLAIELAAARVKVLSPETILRRLESRLELLTGGHRDLPPRQRTLRGAIEWSYDLLDQDERRLFRRLAVFQGGRTLEAIEAVCDIEANSRIQMLDGVRSLVDNSLLRREEGAGGVPRFVMLETIHEFAREKLTESGEHEALSREHALYFMALAEQAAPNLTGPKQQEWFARLEDEHDNIRAALRWASEAHNASGPDPVHEGAIGAPEIGLRLAAALGRFWDVRGYWSEGRQQLRRALSLGQATASDTTGATATTAGPPPSATPASIEYRTARAEALIWAGLWASLMEENIDMASELYDQSLALSKELDDKGGIANALHRLAGKALERGDLPKARSLTEQSLQIYQELGDKPKVATLLYLLSDVVYQMGDIPAARSLMEESLSLRRELGDKTGIALSLRGLGFTHVMEGDLPAARSLYEQSLALQIELGANNNIPWGYSNLALVIYLEGDYPAARSLYEQSLTLQKELGAKIGIVVGLAGLGGVAAGLGQAHRGARLLGAAGALLQSISSVLWPDDQMSYERGIASARAQLGDQGFEKAWHEGSAMNTEQAIAYALEAQTFGERKDR
jgi:predicted ATPase/transcriptional regulator with XRE-family HTH domain